MTAVYFYSFPEASNLFLPQYSLKEKASEGKNNLLRNDYTEGCSCIANEKLRKNCETSVNTLFLNPCMAKTKRPSSNSVSKIIQLQGVTFVGQLMTWLYISLDNKRINLITRSQNINRWAFFVQFTVIQVCCHVFFRLKSFEP